MDGDQYRQETARTAVLKEKTLAKSMQRLFSRLVLLHRGSTLQTGTQRGHSFERLVSMAGVAVVRGARDGPNGSS